MLQEGITIGKLTLTLHRVKDQVTGRIFVPMDARIEFDGKRIYQGDISMISADETYNSTIRTGSYPRSSMLRSLTPLAE
ncbi:MAG: hypothetical protein JW878_02045 [Methanomicrobia archaeon]|nr:hypothetical protein [Methanomicrobia archaeon]